MLSLYSEIEHLIMKWSDDGTKTAGHLTREIMRLLNGENPDSLILSNDDINYLKSKGFKQDETHSGFYYYENDNVTQSIIPLENGLFKLVIVELCYNDDGSSYLDYDKIESNITQTLKLFIELNI